MTETQLTEVALASTQIDDFNRNGYTVVPGVLNEHTVVELRSYLAQLFEQKVVHRGDVQLPAQEGRRGGGVRQDIWSRYPDLRTVMTQPKALGALRSLLGDDFVIMPESVAHDSRYGGWHKDTTPLERAGERFHREPDFRIVECAFYLQDNDEYGGGLDVVPGTHLQEDTTPEPPKVTVLDRVLYKLGRPRLKANDVFERKDALSVPSRAGDFVIFDLRLDHMATQPTVCGVDDLPDEKRKLAIFFSASVNSEHARHYRDFAAEQYEHLKGAHEYPAELQELAERHRLTLI